MTLKKQYEDFVAQRKAAGHAFIAYDCPACNGAIETPQPPKGEQWDSAASCPHCLTLHMKLARNDRAAGRMPQKQQFALEG